jgi:hypothetical protein
MNIIPTAHAATTLGSIINDSILPLISDAMLLLMAVAVLVFVWQVIRYFILPNENRKEAGLYVMYSVIGFFVILSLWGLVNVLSGTFGIGDSSTHPDTWSKLKDIFPRS